MSRTDRALSIWPGTVGVRLANHLRQVVLSAFYLLFLVVSWCQVQDGALYLDLKVQAFSSAKCAPRYP